MLKSHQQTFASLRLLGKLRPGEFISTDKDGNVVGVHPNTMWQGLGAFVAVETWTTALTALCHVYVEESGGAARPSASFSSRDPHP